jgi:hypothetical protein
MLTNALFLTEPMVSHEHAYLYGRPGLQADGLSDVQQVGLRSRCYHRQWEFPRHILYSRLTTCCVGQNTNKHVRLTQDRRSEMGWLWSRLPIKAENYEIEVEFNVSQDAHCESMYTLMNCCSNT